MKLNELTGIKSFPKISDQNRVDTLSSIKNLIESLGFEYLNKGKYAVTFKGKNAVLKIFYNDPAYEAYVNFIKFIPSEYKKFVPKINSVKTYPNNEKIKFVKLPYYETLDMKQVIQVNFTIRVIQDMSWNPDKYYPDMINYKFPNIDEFMFTLEECGFFIRTNDMKFSSKDLKDYDLHFFEFMKFIRNSVPKGFWNDQHSGNFMFDEKINTIILTDPWAKYST